METDLGLWSMVLGAGLIVKFVLLILLAFSIASWAIMFYKYKVLKKVEKESSEFADLFWEAGSFSAISAESKRFKLSPLSKLFNSVYSELSASKKSGAGESPAALGTEMDCYKRVLKKSASIEVARLEQNVPFLATAGNTAPFIGLFGTVWGIMDSFKSIGEKGAANLAVVAPGISEALIATALGLFVAIPAVIGYNHMLTRIDRISAEMDNFSSDLINILEKQLSKKPQNQAYGTEKQGE